MDSVFEEWIYWKHPDDWIRLRKDFVQSGMLKEDDIER